MVDLSGSWLPEAAATAAERTDLLFVALLVIAGACLALLGGGIDLFLLRYRRRSPDETGQATKPSRLVSGMLFVIPLLVVGAIFMAGFGGFVDQVVAPYGAYEIQVEGRSEGWQFTYPNGFAHDTLHVPALQPVKLTLTSADGLHGIRIPAFRLSRDMLPGKETEAWFTATQPGEYPLLAAAYGGDQSGAMNGQVFVHDAAVFDDWLRSAASPLDRLPPIEAGEVLIGTFGCTACHTPTGLPGVGPTFKDLYRSQRTFADGTQAVADVEYLSESILSSTARVVAGFQAVMPNFEGQIGDREMDAIIAYLKSLSEAGTLEAAAAEADEVEQPTLGQEDQ